MNIDLTPVEPTITLKDIKYYLAKIVEKMDNDTKEDTKLKRDFFDPQIQIRVLMDLGKYGCLRDLYCDIMGAFPTDNEIRTWLKEEKKDGQGNVG